MQSLYETIKEILGTGRVGVPVFVRCVVSIAPEEEDIEEVLMKVLTMTNSWLGASPFRVYAQSRPKSGQITVTIHYLEGQSALVSVNAVPGLAASVDLVLLGNKGALYHDSESLSPDFDVTDEPLPIPEWLIDIVDQSLQTGRPVVVEEVIDFE
jgi:hypothetical protein